MSLLFVENLVKRFGDLVAVDGVSFHVDTGEVFGLLGPNGAGKSTTMMIISRVLNHDAGTVRLDGTPVDRRLLGVVPQDLAIYAELTASENLSFFGSLYGLSGRLLADRVTEALDRVGLTNRRNDLSVTFSGGMKRRLNFAAAILHRPKLLILDEPTVGVDPQSRSHLLDCVRSLRADGTAVIYASHYMEEVEALCSRVAIIDHGRVLACDHLPALLQRIPRQVEAVVNVDRLPVGMNPPSALTVESDDDGLKLKLQTTDDVSEANLNKQVSELLLTLAEYDVAVQSIRTREPSLERLFLELTGTRLRD